MSKEMTKEKTKEKEDQQEPYTITIGQTVAILIDGNNIEMSIHNITKNSHSMLNFDKLIPKLLDNRGLNRLIYFREGKSISAKLAERLHDHYHGSVCPCHKSADIPLTIRAMQLAKKVDTIIILSGDSDYVELVRQLHAEGVRVEIAAIEKTTAQILVDEADHFLPITEEDWFTYNPTSSKHQRRSNKRSTTSNNSSNQNNQRFTKKSPQSNSRQAQSSEDNNNHKD